MMSSLCGGCLKAPVINVLFAALYTCHCPVLQHDMGYTDSLVPGPLCCGDTGARVLCVRKMSSVLYPAASVSFVAL